jgi:cob(I)alamin adenosyltransferase
MDSEKSHIHVITGTGAGKTTSSLGVALRSLGWGKKVFVVQFMKGRKEIGEYKVKELLGENYEIHQFGRVEFIDLKNPGAEDKALARQGLAFAKEVIIEKRPDLLILDEINYAMSYNLIGIEDVLALLKEIPDQGMDVYLTGRFCPREIMEVADYVTELVELKRPGQLSAKKGIEY